MYGWRLEQHQEGVDQSCARCGAEQVTLYRRRRLISGGWEDERTALCYGCFQQQMAHPLHPLPRAFEHRLHPNGVTSSTDHRT